MKMSAAWESLLFDATVLNAAWQDFLCGLYPDESGAAPESDSDLPEDLSEKVDAIARELFALEN